MKLSYLLAVVCAAFVSVAPVAATVTLSPSTTVVQVDVGSGGTRMSVFHYGVGEPVMCTFLKNPKSSSDGVPSGVKKTDNCVSEEQILRGRITTTSNPADWTGPTGTAQALVQACTERFLGQPATPPTPRDSKAFTAAESLGANPVCKLPADAKSTFWDPVKFIVTATAGARRVVVETKLNLVDTAVVAGLKSIKTTDANKKLVAGGIIGGNMEAYFGFASTAMFLKKLSSPVLTVADFKNKALFVEIGGASQQFGWFDSALKYESKLVKGHAVPEMHYSGTAMTPFLREAYDTMSEGQRTDRVKNAKASAGFLELQGDMFNYAPQVFPDTPINKIYATSLLGTGGDRTAIGLLKHEAHSDKKNKEIFNPCFAHYTKDTKGSKFAIIKGGSATQRPVFDNAAIFGGTPWAGINTLGDIFTDKDLMAKLNDGWKFVNKEYSDSKAHYDACLKALNDVYGGDNSESNGAKVNNFKTKGYKGLYNTMAEHLQRRNKGVTGQKEGNAGITKVVVSSVATKNSMYPPFWDGIQGNKKPTTLVRVDGTKVMETLTKVAGDVGNSGTGDFIVLKAATEKNYKEAASTFGCGAHDLELDKDNDGAQFWLNSCSAVAEPMALVKNLMSPLVAHAGHVPVPTLDWYFIANDFGQAAALFSNQAEGAKMQLYADGALTEVEGGTFAGEDEVWQGDEIGILSKSSFIKEGGVADKLRERAVAAKETLATAKKASKEKASKARRLL